MSTSVLITITIIMMVTTPMWAAAESVPTRIINAMQTTGNPNPRAAKMSLGAEAALYKAKIEGSSSDTTLHTVSITDINEMENAFTNDTLCVIGPGSDADLKSILANEALLDKHIVMFSPLTETQAVRVWNTHMYFTSPDPASELLALFTFAISFHRPKRLVCMYLSGLGDGKSYLNEFTEYTLAELSMEPPFVFIQSVTEKNLNQTLFDEMIRFKPQFIFILGATHEITAAFFKQVVRRHAEFVDGDEEVTILSSFHSMTQFLNIYQAMRKEEEEANAILNSTKPITSALLPAKQMYFTSPVPLVTDQRFKRSLAVFNDDMETYLNREDAPDETRKKERDMLQTVADRTNAFAGWIGGKVLQRSVGRHIYGGREGFSKNIFQQNRYLIHDDFIIGDYGGNCVGAANDLNGASCRCNQGGHSLYIAQAKGQKNGLVDIVSIDSSGFYYKDSSCYTTGISIQIPFYVIATDITDLSIVRGTYQHMVDAVQTSSQLLYDMVLNKHRIFIATIDTTVANVRQDLELAIKKDAWDVLLGPMPNDHVDPEGILLFDPILPLVELASGNPSAIYVCPTLNQEIFSIFNYVQKQGSRLTVLFWHDHSDSELQNEIRRAADKLGVNLKAIQNVGDDPPERALDATGTTLFLHVTEADLPVIWKHLEDNPEAAVALAFDDFTNLYDPILSMLQQDQTRTPSSANRFFFATNLPSWIPLADNDKHESVFTSHFLEIVTDASLHTPAGMRGYLAVRFMAEVSNDVIDVVSTSFLENLRRRRVVRLDDMYFGPYTPPCRADEKKYTRDGCGRNYGAQRIAIWPLSRVVDPHLPLLAHGITPDLLQTDREDEMEYDDLPALPAWVYSVSVVLFVLLVVLVIIVIYVCCRAQKQSRNNHNAPKNDKENVTIIFTDIQSSTALWSEVPPHMSNAVSQHHEMIRKLIVKYKCYEVKTIGDSFMVATSSTISALRLAKDIQESFMHINWGTDAIDAVYRQHEAEKQQQLADAPFMQLADDEAYASVWNGLRVRIGIHTGPVDIRIDEVSKGYDYYGDTCNVAARTEALGCGGQIILTEHTWNSLADDKDKNQFSVVSLGRQYLRGVPDGINMLELVVNPLRQFPIPHTVPCDEKPTTDSTGTRFSETTISEALDQTTSYAPQFIMQQQWSEEAKLILEVCLSTYDLEDKYQALKRACTRLGICIPDSFYHQGRNGQCEAMINAIAKRSKRIAEYRRSRVASMDEWGASLSTPGAIHGEALAKKNPLATPSNRAQRAAWFKGNQ